MRCRGGLKLYSQPLISGESGDKFSDQGRLLIGVWDGAVIRDGRNY